MMCVTVGEGGDDGTLRVYAGCWNGHVYEFTYSEGSWIKVDVGGGAGQSNMNCIVIGTGRNDDTLRLYGACMDNSIYEFTYSDGTWHSVNLGSTFIGIRSITIAPGRNDGVMRLYIGGVAFMGVSIAEAWYQGGVWYLLPLADETHAVVSHLTLGYGHNDDSLRIYASSEVRPNIVELTYSGGYWGEPQPVSGQIGSPRMYGVAVGTAHNDGVMYVYGSNWDSHIYEFLYKVSWVVEDIGFGGQCTYDDAMRCVTVGKGRNDDTLRVYGSCEDGHIYEFTYRVAGIKEKTTHLQDKKLEVLPNLFSQKTVIRYSFPQAIRLVGDPSENGKRNDYTINDSRLTIHDLAGRLVKSFGSGDPKLPKLNNSSMGW
ncbi:MAG: hypothetical protein QMD71_09660 [bacterium]|nr:hypothetical protein [bacterium]